MIKFFRKIRQNFLLENKTGKYFKYAIGEIILVVIGILIALQINSWNEGVKKSRWEQRFLKDLRNEIQGDFNQLNKAYTIQLKKGKSCVTLLNLMKEATKSKKKKMDSIFTSIQAVNPTFFPTTGVYDAALSAGKLEHIKNDSLKYLITNLYNHYYKRLVYNGEILDQVVERVDWEKGKFYNSVDQKIISWKAAVDQEFYNQINFLKDQNKVYSNLVKSNLNQIKKVIAFIDKETK